MLGAHVLGSDQSIGLNSVYCCRPDCRRYWLYGGPCWRQDWNTNNGAWVHVGVAWGHGGVAWGMVAWSDQYFNSKISLLVLIRNWLVRPGWSTSWAADASNVAKISISLNTFCEQNRTSMKQFNIHAHGLKYTYIRAQGLKYTYIHAQGLKWKLGAGESLTYSSQISWETQSLFHDTWYWYMILIHDTAPPLESVFIQ